MTIATLETGKHLTFHSLSSVEKSMRAVYN